MKAKCILMVVFLLSFNAFSQDYIPMLNHSSWILERRSNWTPSYRILSEGIPVTFNNVEYLQFYDPFPVYVNSDPVYDVWIREDVTARKVYRLDENGAEILIYDFNLQTGDIISQYGWNFTATVDQVDVNGSMRKRITLKTDHVYLGHYVLTQVWIEGVGSEDDSLRPERNMYNVASASGGVKYKTYCSFQNGNHIYGEPGCPNMLLSTENQSYEAHTISLGPNPVIDEFEIQSAQPLQNAVLQLFNVQGQLVKEIHNISGEKNTVSRGNLASGIYLARISQDNKSLVNIKLIVD